MNQKSLLLNYRTECNSPQPDLENDIIYDINLGLWIDKSGEPFIKRFSNKQTTGKATTREEKTNWLENDNIQKEGRICTVETRSREGIDRSEITYISESYVQDSFTKTLITETRESIDRSEMTMGNDYVFNSIQTFTRESIDRSEHT